MGLRGARRRRPRPCPLSSPGGRSSPSVPPSSSAPAPATTTTSDPTDPSSPSSRRRAVGATVDGGHDDDGRPEHDDDHADRHTDHRRADDARSRRCRPIRSRWGSAPGIPTPRRPCCGPGCWATGCPTRSTSSGRSPSDEAFTAVTADGRVTAPRRPTATASTSRRRSTGRRGTGSGPAASPARPVASPRSAPVTTSLRLASASCQHFETGFYAAHRDIAEWAPDLVVFLGDFVYEGASNPVGDGRVRSHDGPEPMDLPGLPRPLRPVPLRSRPARRRGRAAPWLVIWDDHEVENNYAGLEPQDPAERDAFPARRAAAYRAWWEHMPVRLPAPVDGAEYPMYRTVSLGAAGRRDPARRPPVPQRPGLRRRDAVDGPAVPRGARPGPHDARWHPGGVGRRRAGGRPRRRGPCSVSRPC